MDFVFICPEYGGTFSSAEFRLESNRGVRTDAAGNRYLDAEVRLDIPCPLCAATPTDIRPQS